MEKEIKYKEEEKNHLIALVLVAVMLALSLGALISPFQTRSAVAATEPAEMTGWAWSEVPPGAVGLGWISFNSDNTGAGGGDYRVLINTTSGEMSGNAWTLHGYTLTFNSSELGGCPAAPCTARYNPATHSLSGWAKFKYSEDGGGWTGWLSLSGDGYGVLGTESNGVITFSGRAFGGDVTGWVSFDGVTTIPVEPEDFDYSLSNSGNVTITKGGSPVSGQNTVTKTLLSTDTQLVDLSLTGVPADIAYTISSRDCSPTCQSTITFTAELGDSTGTYLVTVTGTPLNKTTSFNLTINPSSGPIVSCIAAPVSSVKVGQSVSWAANVSGGTAPYTYTWSGTNIPNDPAPTTNPFNITYTTVGLKTAQAVVRDSNGSTSTCNPAGTVYVNFDPKFEEF
jgi:hypothetical protein